MKIVLIVFAFILVGFFSLLWLKFVHDRFSLKCDLFRVGVSGRYQKLIGLKVVVFSDLHGYSTPKGLQNIQKIVEAINQQTPDLVLFLGDVLSKNATKNPQSLDLIIGELKNIKSKYGIFAVNGNHDWSYNGKKVSATLHKYGIRTLENSSLTLNNQFNLVGFSDISSSEGPNIELAMADIDQNLPTLAIIHNPYYSKFLPKNLGIIFAGHTHGGQVNIPILKHLFVWYSNHFGSSNRYLRHAPIKKSLYQDMLNNQTFFSGRYRLNEQQQLFVSRGLGNSGIDYRFNCSPQIMIVNFELKR